MTSDPARSEVDARPPSHTEVLAAHASRTRRSTRTRLIAAAGLVTLLTAAVWSATHLADGSAMIASARSWAAEAASALSWQAVVCLVVVSASHYLAAAVSARAVAGVPMRFGEMVAVQLAAAAANRVTPAGLGGAALLGRHLTRRGRLSGPEAAAAVTSLAVVGAVANAVVFAVVVGFGAVLDLAGSRAEVPLLVDRLLTLVPLSGSRWLVVAGVGVVVAPVVVWIALSRSAAATARCRAITTSFLGFARTLVRQPLRMTVMVLASASTTLLLATGFAMAATFRPSGLPVTAFGALVVGYLVAAAAGSAVPAPSGLGAVDAGLAGVLLAAGEPTASAVGIVIAFRLITFWLPAVIGLGLLAPLRRRGAW